MNEVFFEQVSVFQTRRELQPVVAEPEKCLRMPCLRCFFQHLCLDMSHDTSVMLEALSIGL